MDTLASTCVFLFPISMLKDFSGKRNQYELVLSALFENTKRPPMVYFTLLCPAEIAYRYRFRGHFALNLAFRAFDISALRISCSAFTSLQACQMISSAS